MLRLPRGVSPAPGRGGAALPPPAPHRHPKKVMSVMGSVERGVSSLGSPLVPAGSFTQVYTPAAAGVPAPREGGLYGTPQSPQLRTLRSASAGRLPVRCLHPSPRLGIAWVGQGAGVSVQGREQGVGDPRMYSTPPLPYAQLLLGSAPPSDVSLGWGRVRFEIRSRSEMAQTFLNFPSPCKAGSRLPLFSLFRPFLSLSALAHASKPGRGARALCKPFQVKEARAGGTVPARCSSPLGGCDPWGDLSPGEPGGHGAGVVRRRCPSLVPACGYNRACNAFFLEGGGRI